MASSKPQRPRTRDARPQQSAPAQGRRRAPAAGKRPSVRQVPSAARTATQNTRPAAEEAAATKGPAARAGGAKAVGKQTGPAKVPAVAHPAVPPRSVTSPPPGPRPAAVAAATPAAGKPAAPDTAKPAADAPGKANAAPAAPATAVRMPGAAPGNSTPTGRINVRRLLPPVLVVAALTAGTVIALEQDKAVHLSVEGESRTVHTTADDVGSFLAKQGITLRPHDLVAPAADEPLEDGDTVDVRYRRQVRLTVDGRSRTAWTAQRTVAGALDEAGVRAAGAHLSVPVSRSIDRQGLSFDVRTERDFTVVADGVRHELRTNAATVAEAVHRAGISLREEDTVSLPLSAFPGDGKEAVVTRVRTFTEQREEDLAFRVRHVDDGSLLRGTQKVRQKGEKGRALVTYRVRTVDGERRESVRTGSETLREPREKIVRDGRKERPAPPAPTPADPWRANTTPPASGSGGSGGGLDWAALAACESGGRPGVVDPSGTYGGLYQFDARTWQGLGGKGLPQHASPAEQTARAKQLYAQRGRSPWPVCGAKL